MCADVGKMLQRGARMAGAAVEARDGVAKYLKSADRIPFNKDGIFRQYPELNFGSTKPAEQEAASPVE